MDLKDWALKYIQYRDSFEKNLVEIKEEGKLIIAVLKDSRQHWLAEEKLSLGCLKLLEEKESKFLVCRHEQANLEFTIKNWKALAEIKDLTLIFVNKEVNDKWILRPYTHNMIADPKTLTQGLVSMYNAILPENLH